jgi:hypothetical protein
MKKVFSLIIGATVLSSSANAALISMSGHHRFASNWFYNLDAKKGTNSNASDTSSFLEHRLILRPDVLIDERFSLRSELSLMSQNDFDSFVSSVNQVNGGSALDSEKGNKRPREQELAVRQAYMQWNSDIGVFRVGRMAKSWGLGLLYDAGLEAESYASTIVDRMHFEGQMGSLVLGVGFEKYEEGNLHSDVDDNDVYELSVKYENEGAGVGIGLLYARHIRAVNSVSKSTDGYNSSNDFSFFAKKQWENLFIGGELASMSFDDQPDVYGALLQLKYTPGQWEWELDGVYSAGSDGRAFIVHPNYRPFLILFKQPVGASVGDANVSRYGWGVGFDPSNPAAEERGALMGRLGMAYNFSQKKYRLGVVGGYAQLNTPASVTNEKDLGFEVDINFDQQWYDNFKTSLATGVFVPGSAFPEAQMAWGLQFRSYLNF